MPAWNFDSFWSDHPYDIIININVHKYFALCLKYHMLGSTELILNKGTIKSLIQDAPNP